MSLWLTMGCLLLQPAPDGGDTRGPWREVAVTSDKICGLSATWKVACTNGAGGIPFWWDLDVDYKALDGGFAGICALTRGGQIECTGITSTWHTPPERGGFETLSVGLDGACSQHEDGESQCWGDDWDLVNEDLPNEAMNKVSIGLNIAVALLETGEVTAWGNIAPGWEEDLAKVTEEVVDVEAGSSGFVVTTAQSAREISYTTTTWDFGGELEGSGTSYCAKNEEQAVRCLNGDGPALDAPSGLFGDMDTAEDFACGITESGRIRCWGDVVAFPFE